METSDIVKYAQALYRAHGDRAEYEAAQKVTAATEAGDEDEAETWRRVRQEIRQLRGANAS